MIKIASIGPAALLFVLMTGTGASPSCDPDESPTPGETPTAAPTATQTPAAPTPTPTPIHTPGPDDTPFPYDSDNESSLPGCTDGIDNDGDGFIDCADYSCYLSEQDATAEAQAYCFELGEGSLAECRDGADNDGDGYTDCDDWSCTRPEHGASPGAVSYCNGEITPTPTEEVGCVSGDSICPQGCASEGDSDCGADWACGQPFPNEVPWLSGVDDLQDQALENALGNLIDDHNGNGYDSARKKMYGVTDDIDVDPDGYIECIYTGYKARADGTTNPGDINTEHSWPRSEGADSYPKEGDIHHLFPTLTEANGARGTYEFGYTDCDTLGGGGCQWSMGGSKVGSSTDGRSTVFEVRPEYRGDIARAHFYFSVRYGYQIGSLEEAALKQWNCEDPPDADELRRNDDIEAQQENRNPFVDRPDLVLQISDF